MVCCDGGQRDTDRPTIERQASNACEWTNANHKCDKRAQSAPDDVLRFRRFRIGHVGLAGYSMTVARPLRVP